MNNSTFKKKLEWQFEQESKRGKEPNSSSSNLTHSDSKGYELNSHVINQKGFKVNVFDLSRNRQVKIPGKLVPKKKHTAQINNNGNAKVKPLLNFSQQAFLSTFESSADLQMTQGPGFKFWKAVELSPSIILMTDRTGVIEYANPKFLEVSEYRKEEIIGRGLDLFKPDLSSREQYSELRKAIVRGYEWKGELESHKKTGEIFIFSASIEPVRNKYDCITNFVIVGQDITPFKETEKQLKMAVEEKTALMAELHHRVKNNLAIISGLIQLQAFSEDNAGVQDKLLSSVGRVQTMASMHELLYESGSFSKLNFSQNLKKIVGSISKMYFEIKKNVDITFDIEPVQLNINQAHPCSLVINEVITNAFKHAFIGVNEGKVHIQMYAKNETVYLSIHDNGVGLPEGFSSQYEETLGNTLLKMLVEQLGGSYQYSACPSGTTFTLTFEKDDIRGSANASLI